jgi:hypothetical protein
MKKSLGLVGCGVILGLAIGQLEIFGSVSAQTQKAPQKCDYTYIRDNAAPGIGTDGKIEYNDTWRPLIEGGWILKIASAPGAGYIFEKCR